MSTYVKDPPEQTAASLVSGILGDLQHLVQQQILLTRREVEEDLRQRAAAAAVFGMGVGSLFLAAMFLALTLAYLLHWVALPPGSDLAQLPLWACHAVLAAVLAVSGGILAIIGRASFRSVGTYQNPTTELLQEHVPWTTPPK
jgi:Putative Actinobacterial Holin-X, holin superfamily III